MSSGSCPPQVRHGRWYARPPCTKPRQKPGMSAPLSESGGHSGLLPRGRARHLAGRRSSGDLRGSLDPYRWVMDTRNPVLAREATQYATFGKQSAAPADATPEQLQEMYDAPTAPGRLGRVVEGDRALRIHDVI